jgi:hypothetical protein
MDTRIDRFRSITAVILILFMAGFIATACAPAAPVQPTVDPATSAAALQLTEDAVRLQAHQTATAESAALIQQQTSAAQTEAARATPTSLPTATATVTATPRPTMTPDVRPTQQYEAMKAKIDQYVKANYLVSSKGTYRRLDDFTFQWAQLGYYTWEETGYQPADFVIESDIEWSSASTSATLFNTGCGFAFHANGSNDHYAVFLTMDGNVDSVSYYKGNWGHMGQGWYGKVDFPNGKAHIALVVQQDKYYFLVNDKLVKKYNGFQNKLMDGTLGYVVLSGTNKDYGTACKFSNVDLWTIKE